MRRITKGAAALVATLAIAAAAGAAGAQELPARIKDAGVLKSALNAGYPPMEMLDPATNEFTGFDVDLLKAVGDKLGFEVEYLNGAFEAMTPALQSGRVDIIWSGFYDTPARREIFDFIDYLRAGAQFYSPVSEGLESAADLCGKTITTSRGTSYPKTVETWSEKNCVANGKEPIEVIVDTDRGQQLTNLRTGRAVAAVQGLEAVPTILETYPGEFKALGDPISSALMGIAFAKEDTELREAFLAALKELWEDGTYMSLIEKWKLNLSALDEPTVNQGPQP
ncbi:ABC transporter substrate-binding protein [Albimonas sp. CAU 1670]|uniref:ABC transporter substrate-binding protein n=1 Tax=Albimonas sp. CAU 1670 TaxID=3032599 RepID=UPI0023DC8CFC|nr:ABC transporter substrate-binding protein [Albimonas sp. CAU 1670]MDF2235261.1 ABC transporter substrate-binding protein [Albimonas sp. CAU 1670]